MSFYHFIHANCEFSRQLKYSEHQQCKFWQCFDGHYKQEFQVVVCLFVYKPFCFFVPLPTARLLTAVSNQTQRFQLILCCSVFWRLVQAHWLCAEVKKGQHRFRCSLKYRTPQSQFYRPHLKEKVQNSSVLKAVHVLRFVYIIQNYCRHTWTSLLLKNDSTKTTCLSIHRAV